MLILQVQVKILLDRKAENVHVRIESTSGKWENMDYHEIWYLYSKVLFSMITHTYSSLVSNHTQHVHLFIISFTFHYFLFDYFR